MPTALAWPSLEIDYPSQDELVSLNEGSFRIDAPEDAATVEISIDRGPWNPCRRCCGFWWYDWMNIPAGSHTMFARGTLRDGVFFASAPRHFKIARTKAHRVCKK